MKGGRIWRLTTKLTCRAGLSNLDTSQRLNAGPDKFSPWLGTRIKYSAWFGAAHCLGIAMIEARNSEPTTAETLRHVSFVDCLSSIASYSSSVRRPSSSIVSGDVNQEKTQSSVFGPSKAMTFPSGLQKTRRLPSWDTTKAIAPLTFSQKR